MNNKRMQNSFLYLVLVLVLVCIIPTPSVTQVVPTKEQLTPEVMDEILSIIDRQFFTTSSPLPINLATALRGTFHECIAGCDGSINLNNVDNRGLDGAFSKLHRVFSPRTSDYFYLNRFLT